jgi:DNA-directed RNA polymerase sigma subunit (sigma70/sigma32)
MAQVGELIGLSKKRVHQIERQALKKFLVNARKMGFDAREMLEAMCERDDARCD